jgi:hypothetical protein
MKVTHHIAIKYARENKLSWRNKNFVTYFCVFVSKVVPVFNYVSPMPLGHGGVQV